VRAKDSSGNVDPTPAGYSFTIVIAPAPIDQAPAPSPAATPAPLPSHRTAAPTTTITLKPAAKTHDRTPTFRFSSNKSGAGFQCKLDRGPFVRCRSPYTTKTLALGPHTLAVRATVGGAVDQSPAKLSFKIVKKG
jgi:hypothetical protein